MILSMCNMLGPKMVIKLRNSVTTLTIMGPKMINKCTLITKMVPNICANLWVPLDYHIGSTINIVSQYTSKVQDSIHKTILGPNILHRPISGPYKNTSPGGQLIFWKFKNFLTQNAFSVPNWVFLTCSIKMTMKVPGTISAKSDKLVPLCGPTMWTHYVDPLCGPTMENVQISFAIFGPKDPGWTLLTTHCVRKNLFLCHS